MKLWLDYYTCLGANNCPLKRNTFLLHNTRHICIKHNWRNKENVSIQQMNAHIYGDLFMYSYYKHFKYYVTDVKGWIPDIRRGSAWGYKYLIRIHLAFWWAFCHFACHFWTDFVAFRGWFVYWFGLFTLCY